MALTAMSNVKVGDKVEVAGFTGTVTDGSTASSCTRITDAAGKVSYVYRTQLYFALPYLDGETYADANGSRFTYVAATRQWRSTGGTFRSFEYPSRPLRQVTLGPELAD